MEIQLTPSYILTDESSSPSYGKPVLLNRQTGETFGPGNIIRAYPSWNYQPALDAVKRMAAILFLNREQRQFIDKF